MDAFIHSFIVICGKVILVVKEKERTEIQRRTRHHLIRSLFDRAESNGADP